MSRATVNAVLPQAPGFNAGMAAVDLGLLSAAAALGVEVVPWRLAALSERALSVSPDLDRQMDAGLAPTQLIAGEWPDDVDDPIIYFGDFHHMATYVDDVGRIIGSSLDGHVRARRYLLLDGVSQKVKSASTSFGTTLIFNSNQDFRDSEYGPALHDLLTKNAGTLFRDPISTSLVRRFRPDGKIGTGVDPALLIDPNRVPANEAARGAVGVFLRQVSEDASGPVDGRRASRRRLGSEAGMDRLGRLERIPQRRNPQHG